MESGRPMPGMLIVSAADLINDASLRAWIQEAVAIAAAQSPKPTTVGRQQVRGQPRSISRCHGAALGAASKHAYEQQI